MYMMCVCNEILAEIKILTCVYLDVHCNNKIYVLQDSGSCRVVINGRNCGRFSTACRKKAINKVLN